MPDDASRPLVIAHRGASAEAPENTIAAFELAIQQGADAIELDVHLSGDDQLVVIHDWTLERTTDGAGAVRDRSVQELKRLDAGSWHSPAFRGQRLQTLLEVLERFRDRTRFWIELKAGSDLYPGIEERVVTSLEIYDVLDRTLVQSFDHGALRRARTLSPEVRLGALVAQPPLDPSVVAPGLVQAVCPGAHLLTEGDIALIREAGLGCYVWTVNEPALMDRLVSWGVSGIITDRPALLRARLAGH
ncbi:MAG: glycerophosphodiester phosphodiesterase [Candidatus Rokubacteria bacterium]|nr:glycerophosphodiester phosphodiesterase [Candidatus Rokubacteria bacterium]MBI3104205.1 glycerophosphodiester phosphodiesterase [Candidatus Rokubacteria bacterium]